MSKMNSRDRKNYTVGELSAFKRGRDSVLTELALMGTALNLAVGELSTYGRHSHRTPDETREHIMNMARVLTDVSGKQDNE